MNTCYKTSDNKYRDCPPRMSDGRHFTDYRPVCDVNNLIKLDNNIQNSLNYRNFLQENGEELIDKNREYACMMNCCGPCDDDVEGFESTMLPELIMQETNERNASYKQNNPKGLGLGRNHYKYPVEKCENLPNGWPRPKKGNDCMTLQDKYMCYGDSNVTHGTDRLSLPGGAKFPADTHPWNNYQPMDPQNNKFMSV